MGRIFFLLCALAVVGGVAAPIPENRGAAGLDLALKRVHTQSRVLYVVAHPDDEDAGTLTLLARGHGAQVTLLSLTRGESGANLITGDFFDRLGALRTVEHRKAAEHYGVELRYTRFADFGYSKNVEETWRNWDREQVLRDVVYHIRKERPHVIIARFQGTPRDGHGHHQASGMLAREAFAAAANPSRFADLGLPAWGALKLYCDNWRAADEGVLAVDAGVYNPILGRSYAEIGREGYRFQRSQGMGNVPVRPGPFVTYYKLLESRLSGTRPTEFFLDGLGDAVLPPPSVRAILAGVKRDDAAKPLAAALTETRRLRAEEDSFDLAALDRNLQRALAAALAVELETRIDPPALRLATKGQTFQFNATVHVRTGAPVETVSLRPVPGGGAEFSANELGKGRFEIAWLGGRSTAAHWRRDNPFAPHYDYTGEGNWFGLSLPPAPLTVQARLRYAGIEFTVESAPIAAGPALALKFATASVILPVGRGSFESEVVLRNTGHGARTGNLRLELPAGWTAEPARAAFAFEREDDEARFRFRVKPGSLHEGTVELRAAAESSGERFDREFERITYEGLETMYLEAPARQIVRAVDVKVAPGLKTAYVMGSGDEVPQAMRQLGIDVEMLDDGALASADLSSFHAIVLGIRAYAARAAVRAHNSRLLDYVRNGGTLIVQYNTPEFDNNYGPYPYSMTARTEETSEENAPVTILAGDERVFQWPNKITPADFEGWVEQRGSKFFMTWDSRYVPMIETHDTGQAPQKGVWLQARYGKGLYVYCALAWYRQLPFAVPGAARIFANLVSQGARP